MSLPAYIAAVFLLLATPGPTNTMLALAGAERRLGHALRLLPVELCGYLLTVVPLSLLAPQMVGRHPEAAIVLKVIAAAWLLVLGSRLWLAGRRLDDMPSVGARQVFLTTLLNPKALIFGLALIPAGGGEGIVLRLIVFAVLVVSVGCGWTLLGHHLRRSAMVGRGQGLIRRIAAVALLIFSATLAGSVFAAGLSS